MTFDHCCRNCLIKVRVPPFVSNAFDSIGIDENSVLEKGYSKHFGA